MKVHWIKWLATLCTVALIATAQFALLVPCQCAREVCPLDVTMDNAAPQPPETTQHSCCSATAENKKQEQKPVESNRTHRCEQTSERYSITSTAPHTILCSNCTVPVEQIVTAIVEISLPSTSLTPDIEDGSRKPDKPSLHARTLPLLS